MQRVIKQESMDVDAVEAQRMLEMWPYDRQRNLRRHAVEEYVHLLKSGQWMPGFAIEIGFAPDENGHQRGYLLDGQHRLTAVLVAGVSANFTVRHIEFDSREEMATRYGVIDTNLRRTGYDMTKALNLGDKWGMNNRQAEQLQNAVKFFSNDFIRRSKNPLAYRERLAIAEQYQEAMHTVLDYFNGGVPMLVKQLLKQGPLAVALVTVRDALPELGEECVASFWDGVAHDDGLRQVDPRKVVVRHLMVTAQYGNAKKGEYSAEYTARLLASCFNAHVEGRELRMVRITDQRGPMVIRGTRWGKEMNRGEDGN